MPNTVEQKILALMLDGSERHITTIATALELKTTGHITSVLTQLNRKGKVVRTKPGTYKMPDKWANNPATLRKT